MSRAKGRGLLSLVLGVLLTAGVAAGADAQTRYSGRATAECKGSTASVTGDANVVSLTIDDQTIVVSGAPNGGES
jgi:hypothetical protein